MEALRSRIIPACLLAAGLLASSCIGRDVVDSPLLEIVQITPNQLAKNLDRKRPAALDAELRRRVIESLPKSGHVEKLTSPQRNKLASIDSVLHAHNRDSVYALRVISLPEAVVALYARSVVLISAPALSLLTAEELQAVVAHEIGHEYFWDEYLDASGRKKLAVLRKLELWCDAISIMTLRQVNADPRALITAVEKLDRYNLRFGTPPGEIPYPPSADRKRFMLALIDWSTRQPSPPSNE